MFGIVKLTWLGCVIDAVLITLLVANSIRIMNEIRDGDGEKRSWVYKLDFFKGAWLYALILGVGTGLVRYFAMTTEIVWLVPILFAVSLVLLALLCYVWYLKHEADHEWMQAIGIVLAGVIMVFDMVIPVARLVRAIIDHAIWGPVVFSIAPMVAIAAFGYIIIDACYYRSREVYTEEGEEEEELAKKYLYAGRIAIAVTTLAMLIAFAANFNWPALISKGATEPAQASSVSEADFKEAQDNLTIPKLTAEDLEKLTTEKYKNIPETLLDSSLSPHDRDRTDKTGFSDALTFGFAKETKEDQFLEIEEEILRNPVYGVTVAKALVDKKVGSKTLGELNPWMQEMIDKNEKGVFYWLEYRDAEKTAIYVTQEYRIYAATLCTLLERMTIEGVQTRQTVENWALNLVVKNNEREGVKADYQYKKEALVLEVKTKDGNVLLRMGFNIHDKRPEFFKDEPEPEPTKTPTNTPTPKPDPDPTPTPKPNPDPTPTPDPDPTPTPDPTPKKDPEKAPKENTEPNDNPGPGPDTNNGVGAQHSTADQDTNSDHYPSYDEYKQDMEEMEQINDTQQEAGDPNTPSTTPKPGTNVDNNGDKGTGNGGADAATPTQPPAHEAGSGQEISDNPGEAWGGPPD